MVSLELVRASNSQIRSALPDGLVAVFVGGTNGVGETTLKQLAKYAARPRVYIVGRSQEAGDRIAAECSSLNPEGTFVFLKRDTSLMRGVDEVCGELAGKEEAINLLFLTIGTLQRGIKTEEGLHYPAALTIYARSRFITNLLPQLRRARGLRRVISVFGATFEGAVDTTDLQAWKLGRMANMRHDASLVTLDLEAHRRGRGRHRRNSNSDATGAAATTTPAAIATAAEEQEGEEEEEEEEVPVSFVHAFPGSVESGIARGNIGWLMRFLKTVVALLGPLAHTPLEEAGDRHLFLCTSARYPVGNNPADADADGADGVPLRLVDGLAVARGTDGRLGSGVYSIDAKGESAAPGIEKLLADYRSKGLVEEVRRRIEEDIGGALASGKGRSGL